MDNTIEKQKDRYLFIGLLALIAWLPFPHASVEPWAYALFETVTFFLLSLWLLSFYSYTTKRTIKIIVDNKLALSLLASWLLYHLIQIIPLPSGLIEIISPSTKYIYDYTQQGNTASFLTLSISPTSTLDSFLINSSYIALFFLTLVLVNTRKRLKQLGWLVCSVGAIQSLYSLVNFYTDGQFSLLDPLPPWEGNSWSNSVRGTYSHYNHFAGLLILTIPIGLGLYFTNIKMQEKSLKSKSVIISTLDFMMSEKPLIALVCSIMLVALFQTGSRGGNGAILLSFIITSLILITYHGFKSKEIKRFVVILMLVFISTSWLGMGVLTERVNKYGSAQSKRDVMRASTYELIGDFSIFGSGAGSFKDINPMYTDSKIGGSPMWAHAHMDYLELLADQGIVGFITLGLALTIFGKTMLKGMKNRRDPLARGMLLASFMGTTAAYIHALIDHNFQITANASYFFILLAIGVIASNLQSQSQSQSQSQ